LPITDAVGAQGKRAIDRARSYESGVRSLYGDTSSYLERSYSVKIGKKKVNGVADAVTQIAGQDVAIEAKYVEDWAKSLRNPQSKYGQRIWALREQRKMVAQARKYTGGAYSGGVYYHTNSRELAAHYTRAFNEAGITNFKFFITPVH
jgi:filamentous hemagglutinin